MELRVESAEGSSLPNGTYVGVRVGDVLKQGRYEPQRCYHFPQVDRRRNAKIDIYQHVGSCVVAVDPDTKSNHEVTVTSTDSSFPLTKIKVSVQSKSDEQGRQQREERTKVLKNQAKDYLSKHNIEERLSEAVKALLKEQPADPTEFLCRHLSSDSPAKAEKLKPQAPAKVVEAAKAPQETPQEPPAPVEPAVMNSDNSEAKDIHQLRKQAAEALFKANLDGSLTLALRDVKAQEPIKPKDPVDLRKKASVDGSLGQILKEIKAEAVNEAKANLEPIKLSLDYESPAHMVYAPVMHGPAVVGFGMQPGFMFI